MKHSKDTVMSAYHKVKDILLNSADFSEKRKAGLSKLFEYLDNETQWLKAPASTRYHCSNEGGLLEHSINVASQARKAYKPWLPDYSPDVITLVALLHDIGKHCEYIQNPPTPAQKQYGYPGSYVLDTTIKWMPHEDRSAYLATKYIPDLTEEEFAAITLHNEPHLTNVSQFKNCPLATYVAMCDYWCCNYVEDRN